MALEKVTIAEPMHSRGNAKRYAFLRPSTGLIRSKIECEFCDPQNVEWVAHVILPIAVAYRDRLTVRLEKTVKKNIL